MTLILRAKWIHLLLLGIVVKSATFALGALFVSQSSAWINHTFVDLWGWLDFMKRSVAGGVPFVDFSKEYPVGAGGLYWLMGMMNPDGDPTRFLVLHGITMSLWDIGNALLFYSILKELRADRPFLSSILFLMIPTSLILSPVRFEAVVLTSVLLGYRMHYRRRFHWATVLWSAGAMIKFFPLLFVAIQEIDLWNSQKNKWKKIPWHGIGAGLLVFLVFLLMNGPFLVAGFLKNGNVDAWLSTYRFHVDRPLYWDTILGVMHLWWGSFSWERHASAWSSALMLFFLFRPSKLRIEARSTIMMCAALLFNRVYSTQFHLWFYPMFLILISTTRKRARFLTLLFSLIFLDVVNVLVYPFTFSNALEEISNFQAGAARVSGGGWTVLFSLLIGVRAVLLVWVMTLMGKEKAPIDENR